MKTHFFLFLMIVFLFLAGCAPQEGVFEVQVVPAAQAEISATNLEELEPLAMAFLSGISDDRRPFFRFQPTTCVSAGGESVGQPACIAGETEGAAIRVFPMGGLHRNFLRPEEIGQVLDWMGDELYAIYQVDPESETTEFWPRGEYGLILDRYEGREPSPITAIAQDGMLVRLDVYPGLLPEEVLGRLAPSQVVLTPAQAAEFSAPLKEVNLLSQQAFDPQGNWEVSTLLGLPKEGGERYYRRMVVSSLDQSVQWKVVEEWAPYGAGYTAPMPFSWTMDQTALYWTNVPTPEGCVVFANASDLHRLDLQTGASTQLVGPVGQWLALSPDETRVAAAGPRGLTVYDLATREERTLELPEGQAGMFVWSPLGDSLLLTLAQDGCSGQPAYSILKVDLANWQVSTLVDRDPRRFSTIEWSAQGPVLVADQQGDPWLLDPETGELWQETGPSQPASGAIFGWVGRADAGPSPEGLLAGILVRLGAGECPSAGLAETTTITTDISYSFTDLPAGTYCVSIDPDDPANRAILKSGRWVLPLHTEGVIQTTIVLAEGESRYNADFQWMPAQ